MAYQAFDKNVGATILALAILKKDTAAFLFTPEMDVFRGDDLVAEIDLLVIADGRVIVGEAKTTDGLEATTKKEREKLGRLATVAEAVTADEVVLATTMATWQSTTADLARTIL